MKVGPLPLLLLVLLVVGCSNIVIEGQFFQPAEATATALAIRAAPTTDRGATAAIERAVRLTLTAVAPTPTNAPAPSPGAYLIAFPEFEAVEGWEWPEGAVVHLAIDDLTTAASPDFERDGIMAVTTWGDPRTYVGFGFADAYDLKVGDIVMVTDGTTRRTHVVRNLSVKAVDAAADTVAGTADAGAVIQVWPHGFDPTATVQVTADADGAWLADFAGLFDLAAGTGGRSRILDEAGNSTAVDWTSPTPSPSPTAEPATAIPPTNTPTSTATKKPPIQATPTPALTNADSIAGNWAGTLDNTSVRIDLFIQTGCTVGNVCGTASAPLCSVSIALVAINGDTFAFVEQLMTGDPNFCPTGGYEYLRLRPDGTLSYTFRLTSPSGETTGSAATLRRP